MRIRRNPKARKALHEHPAVFEMDEIQAETWRTFLSHPNQPLYVELGTGKGQFITTAAQRYPNINWIGIERIPEPLYQAVKKAMPYELDNLLYFWTDIEYLDQFFSPGEVDRFYLHFSDPWPKKRHQKRRLTHRRFLAVYQKLLSDQGELIFKTDSPSFFQFSLEELTEMGWQVHTVYEDLHNSPLAADNIQTEYEMKFRARGLPIYFLQATPH